MGLHWFGSMSNEIDKINNYSKSLKLYLRKYVLGSITYGALHIQYIFHVKFNFLWRQSRNSIRTRIRMDPHWFGSLDPDPDLDPH